MIKPIILIGPMATGKSTIAGELAKLIGVPQVPMDRLRWYYYFKKGFSLEKQNSIESFIDVMTYWKPFEVDAVQRIIAEFPDSIIDFGAGHSFFTEPDQFQLVSETLKKLPNVILLLPSEDKEESLKICNERLKERKGKELDENEIIANKNFIEERSNYDLAKHIVYTKNKTPEQTALEVKNLLT